MRPLFYSISRKPTLRIYMLTLESRCIPVVGGDVHILISYKRPNIEDSGTASHLIPFLLLPSLWGLLSLKKLTFVRPGPVSTSSAFIISTVIEARSDCSKDQLTPTLLILVAKYFEVKYISFCFYPRNQRSESRLKHLTSVFWIRTLVIVERARSQY